MSNHYSLLHYACTDVSGRRVFIEFLYGSLWEFYYIAADSLYAKIGVIYALFFVYITQPGRPTKFPIPLSEGKSFNDR